MKKPIALASAAALLGLAIVGVVAVNASAAPMNFTAQISGANEVPPGDVTAYTGSATITVDPVTFQVCVVATLNNPVDDPVILDHIHQGAAGVAGPVVVNFNNNLNTCVTSDGPTTAGIVANPAGFYFNVHTMNHQGGAARGQLVVAAVTTTAAPTTTVAPATIATVAPIAAANPAFTG